MPRIVTPLTDSKIKATIAKHKKEIDKKAQKLSDGQGLYLFLDKANGVYWRFDYTRPISKKRNTISIGLYPEITLAQARAERDKFRSQLAQGLDPKIERTQEEYEKNYAQMMTFEYVAREFMQTETIKESTKKRNLFAFQYLFNAIGKHPINEITARELLEVIRLYDSQGKNETARRMRSKASQVFRYAIALGYCSRNVANDIQGIIKSKRAKHFSAITNPNELGKLLNLIDKHHNENSIAVSYALRILPHVFVRPGDLRHARWQDIYFDEQCWKFTPAKTADSYNIELVVPLSTQVLELFKELHLLTGQHEYCFWSPMAKTGIISDSTINKALKKIGFENGETKGHGFRATARTLLDEVLKFPIERIEQQLGHQVRDMNGRAYNRTTYLDERRVMMQAWSDYLDSLKNEKIP